MANPVVSIGHPGSSRYRVDHSARMHDQALALAGLGEIADKIQDRRHDASLAELFAGKADHGDFIKRAVAAGVPVSKATGFLSTMRGLAPPPRKTGKDAAGRLRYLDTGGFAFPDMADYSKDERTKRQKDFEYFKKLMPGLTPEGFFKMSRGGTTVNVSNLSEYRKRYGSNPPANHIWTGREVRNEQGLMVPELVAVGEAARKIAEGEGKAGERAETARQRANIVGQHVGAIRKMVADESFFSPVTGVGGSLMANIPASKAHDMQQRLATLKALVGFKTLNEMRAQSRTGGALGNITERELSFLQSVIGSLEQSQSQAQFLENLALVERAFKRAIDGPPNAESAARELEAGTLTLDQLPRALWGQVREILARNAALAGRG